MIGLPGDHSAALFRRANRHRAARRHRSRCGCHSEGSAWDRDGWDRILGGARDPWPVVVQSVPGWHAPRRAGSVGPSKTRSASVTSILWLATCCG